MEENTTVQNEAEELSAETLAAFDEGWDGDDTPVTTDDGQDDWEDEAEEPETDSESEDEEADADQQEADDDEGGEDADAEEGEGEGDEGPSDQDEYVLKHLGEETTVSRDEVVALAQKGMDYDRIREKWDSVKDEIPLYQMEHEFLQELAESRGGDILSLIDETRIRAMIAQAEARGETLSPAAAAAMAVQRRGEFNPGAYGDPEVARQERSQREVSRFLAEYPGVRAEDIPPELWEKVRANDGDLVGTYRAYENQKLKEELKSLKKELEDETQQKKNKARSTGSSKSVGSSSRRSAFDEGWDAEY